MKKRKNESKKKLVSLEEADFVGTTSFFLIKKFSSILTVFLLFSVFTVSVLYFSVSFRGFFVCFSFFIPFWFYFIFKLYYIVLVLPNIEMNPPQVYMCSPSWTLLPPPSPYHPSGSSQCTSPKHPVSSIEPGLATHFIYDIICISMTFSQIIPP